MDRKQAENEGWEGEVGFFGGLLFIAFSGMVIIRGISIWLVWLFHFFVASEETVAIWLEFYRRYWMNFAGIGFLATSATILIIRIFKRTGFDQKIKKFFADEKDRFI